MSFSTFSKDITANMYTSVENQFITKYLPQADGDCVRAYLYGLYLCQCAEDFDAENAAKLLGIPLDRFVDIFVFWEECDLVRVLSKNPLYVEYLPVNAAVGKPKSIRPEKYAQFNREFYKILQRAKKDFKPYEMQRILEFLENSPMEQQAFLLVAEYCVQKDGEKLTASHILNKANKLCKERKYTYEQVEQDFADFNSRKKELTALVFKTARKLNVNVQNAGAYGEEYAEKWLEHGFDEKSLLELAALCLNLGYGFPEMDHLLGSLYKKGIADSESLNAYCAAQKKPLALIQRIQSVCGVIKKTQSALDMIATWLGWGFTDEMILEAARRSANASAPLPYMNKLLTEWMKLGVFKVSEIPEKATKSGASTDYRAEAAIAADMRSSREQYYAKLQQKAIAKAEKARALAEKDEAFKAAEGILKKGEIELARAEIFAPESLTEISARLEKARKDRADALSRLKLTDEDLQPKFACGKCSDTGFLPNGKMCDCYKEG